MSPENRLLDLQNKNISHINGNFNNVLISLCFYFETQRRKRGFLRRNQFDGGGETGRGAGAGVGVCVPLSMNVGETGKGDGRKKRLARVKEGQRTRLRGERSGEETRKAGRMSERVASCGSLYDSTNLLLQYCNNGEDLLLISP